MGHVPGMRGWHDVAHQPDATAHPGLVIYRFGAGIVFFNSGHFKKRVMELVASRPGTEWLILDGSSISTVDMTGAEVLESLAGGLAAQGIRLGIANVHPDVRDLLEKAGTLEAIGGDAVFATLNTASDAFLARKRA